MICMGAISFPQGRKTAGSKTGTQNNKPPALRQSGKK